MNKEEFATKLWNDGLLTHEQILSLVSVMSPLQKQINDLIEQVKQMQERIDKLERSTVRKNNL